MAYGLLGVVLSLVRVGSKVFLGFVEDLVLELVKCLFAVYLRLVQGLCKDDIQGLIFRFCLRLVGWVSFKPS